MSSDWFGEDGTNGTCTVTNGSPNVTFTGANLLSNIAATKGDGFKGPDGKVYGISAVTAENAIMLAANYQGTDGADQPFAIIPLLGGRSVALGKLVSTLLNSSSYSQIAGLAPAVGDFTQFVAGTPNTWINRSTLQVAFSLFSAITEENVASAATTDIGAGTSPKKSITGAGTITSLGTVPNAVRLWRAASNPSVQMNNGVSNAVPGGANLQLQQGDIGLSFSDAQGTPVWRHFIQRAHGGAAVFTGVTGTGNDVGSNGPLLTGQVKMQRNSTFGMSNGGGLYVQNATTPAMAVSIGYDSTAGFGYIQSRQEGVVAKPLVFNPDGGSVGIGPAIPTAPLQITAGLPILTLQPSAYIAGTTNYRTQLGTDAAATGTLLLGNSANNEIRAGSTLVGGYLDIFVNNTTYIGVASDGLLATRITSSGNVLHGYTTSNGSYKLQVNSQIFATSSTVATSHGPYKDNQQPLTGCLALIEALQPKTFTWKQGAAAGGISNPNFGQSQTIEVLVPQRDEHGEIMLDESGAEILITETREEVDNREWLREPHNFPAGMQVGFVAQEVEAALAGTEFVGAVIKTNIRAAPKDDSGTVVGEAEEFKGIAEGNLIALLAGAVKELSERNGLLEARLTAAGIP